MSNSNQLKIREFVPPSKTPTSPPLTVTRVLRTAPEGSYQDHRFFDHYSREAAPQFVGSFGYSFWTSYIPQACSARPAVYRAVVAVGALHYSYLRNAGRDFKNQLALFHASKYYDALQHLNRRIVNDDVEILEETLTTCVLLTLYEVLRGDNNAALVHLAGGLQPLRNLQSRESSKPGETETTKKPTTHNIFLEEISNLFARLDIQASSLVDGNALGIPVRFAEFAMSDKLAQSKLVYSNLDQARNALVQLLAATWDLLQRYATLWKYCFPEEVPPEVLSIRRASLSDLTQWLSDFHILLESQNFPLNPKEIQSCYTLRMQYLAASIRLSTCFDPEELTYDSYIPKFKEIVDLGSFLLVSPTSISNKQVFSFTVDLGLIYPLYFTAFKCRHLDTRQTAIQLLKVAGREGPWDGLSMALIAEKIMEVEELGRVALGAGDEVVPESTRVHGAYFDVNGGNPRQLECSFKDGKESQEWIQRTYIL